MAKKKKTKIGKKLYKHLTSVRFRTGGKVFELDMGEELLIKPDDPHGQIERLPAIMGYFSSIVALLEEEYRHKADIKKKIEGEIDKSLRETGLIGENRIDKAIKRDPRWLDSCIEVNKSRRNYRRAKGIYAALASKASVLHTRSADIRATPSDSLMGVSKDEVIVFGDDEDDEEE